MLSEEFKFACTEECRRVYGQLDFTFVKTYLGCPLVDGLIKYEEL